MVGDGKDWRFEAEDVVGQALVVKDTCAHLAAHGSHLTVPLGLASLGVSSSRMTCSESELAHNYPHHSHHHRQPHPRPSDALGRTAKGPTFPAGRPYVQRSARSDITTAAPFSQADNANRPELADPQPSIPRARTKDSTASPDS